MIKATLNRKVREPLGGYPYTGINYMTDTVILFTKKNTGTILHHKDELKIGQYNTCWNECLFRICPHTVYLKNE